VDVADAVRCLFFQPSDAFSEESDDDSDYSEYSEESVSEGKMCLLAFILFKHVADELSDVFAVDLVVIRVCTSVGEISVRYMNLYYGFLGSDTV
jgi:hypothetical protein